MEKQVKIRTKDGHIIYGTLNRSSKMTNKLIIFVHGLTGFRNEHIFYNSAKFFPRRGFDVFRFDFYPGEKMARTLLKSTIKSHVEDTKQVIRHFSPKYDKYFLVGHSIGGLTVLLVSMTEKPAALVAWDPSVNVKNGLMAIGKYCVPLRGLNAYRLQWGVDCLISKKMFKEFGQAPHPKQIVTRIDSPIKVICAGKNVLVKGCREYYRWAKKPKSFAVIKNADHNFDEEGTEDELLRETLGWVRKF